MTDAQHGEARLFPICGGKDSVEVRMKALAAQWLSYDDGNYEQRLDVRPNFFFFLVRFDRPSGWESYRVTKMKMRFSTSGQDSIRLLGYDTRYSSTIGNYFPSDRLYMSEPLDPRSGENIFSVDWPLSLERFCAGYFQLESYAPDLYYDTTAPKSRSYLVALENGRLKGYLFNDVNWAIQVYVERGAGLSLTTQNNTSEGQWLSPTVLKIVDGTSYEVGHLPELQSQQGGTLAQVLSRYAGTD